MTDKPLGLHFHRDRNRVDCGFISLLPADLRGLGCVSEGDVMQKHDYIPTPYRICGYCEPHSEDLLDLCQKSESDPIHAEPAPEAQPEPTKDDAERILQHASDYCRNSGRPRWGLGDVAARDLLDQKRNELAGDRLDEDRAAQPEPKPAEPKDYRAIAQGWLSVQRNATYDTQVSELASYFQEQEAYAALLRSHQQCVEALKGYADPKSWYWSEAEGMWCWNRSGTASFAGPKPGKKEWQWGLSDEDAVRREVGSLADAALAESEKLEGK